MTKISIILPVYNTEAYLEQAIHSVLAQTHKNWELIAINDGSTDGSLEILEQHKKTDLRIKLFDLKKNQGLGYVRNLGLQKATGDYIIFLDSDDYLAPDALETLNKHILKKPKTEVFVWGFKTFTIKKVNKPMMPIKPDLKIGEIPFSLGLLCRKGFQPVAWVYAVKKKSYQSAPYKIC